MLAKTDLNYLTIIVKSNARFMNNIYFYGTSIVFFIGKNNNTFFNDAGVVVGCNLSVPAFKQLSFECFLNFN